MSRKLLLLILLALLIGTLNFASRVEKAKASGTIYIRATGLVEGTDKIQRDGDVYTFTDNINDSIVVQKSDIVIDGNGYMVWGSGDGYGFSLTSVGNITIEKVHIENFFVGIYLDHSLNVAISETNITNNYDGIWLEYSSNNSVSGNNITANTEYGIHLYSSSNNNISGTNIANNYDGITLGSSSGNSIFGNNITANGEHGVRLSNSSNNKIFGNNIAGGGDGINLYISNGNNVTGNTVSSMPGEGVFLEYSGYNSVSGNVITNNKYGVILEISTGNILRSNNMTGNSYNMGVYGIDGDLFHLGSVSLSSFLHDIDSSNTVNGKPVCYWVNQHGNRIPEDAGFIAAINCTGITVSSMRITKNVQGILFAFTTDSVVQNLTVVDNKVGVHLVCSDNNTVTASNVTGNKYGISLYYSSRNDFTQNIVAENDYFGVGLGIGLASGYSMYPPTTITSEGNLFRGNLISNNAYGWGGGLWLSNPGTRYTIIVDNNITGNSNGVHLRESSNNSIYHNNFVDNYPQVYVETSGYANFWDNGVEGNYWNNYTGVDSDQDGIGDTPHIMDVNNQDNHPMMGMFHSFKTSYDIQVNIIGNSSISNFDFNLINQTHAELIFYVTGDNESEGFCRICIPKILISGSYTVKFDGEVITYPQIRELPCSNETHEYLCINYTHSQHMIEVSGTTTIPEFPSFLILPLFFIATLLAVMVYTRKNKISDVM